MRIRMGAAGKETLLLCRQDALDGDLADMHGVYSRGLVRTGYGL
jgi:hypothetical protein